MNEDSNATTDRRAASGELYDETIFASPEVIAGQRVVLHAERLVPVITRVRGRLAKVTRRAVTVRRQIEVDVTHEELVVEYEPGDGTEMVNVEGQALRILLHAEEVVVTKNVRVVEEVHISTRPVTELQRFAGVSRYEVLELPPAFNQ